MKLTPVYNPTFTFLRVFPALLPLVIALIMASSPFMIASNFAYFSYVILFAGIAWLAITSVFMHLIKHNYAQTYYELDEDKIIYFDGFLNLTRKEILYKRVLEIDFRQGFFQKKYGLGTVFLVTNSASSNQATAGITIRDLENSHEAYEAIKKIVYPHIKAN